MARSGPPLLRLDKSVFRASALDDTLARITNTRPLEDATAAAWRDLIVQEIQGRFWRPPSGSKRSWKPTHAFGSRTPSDPTFGSAYLAAWRGGPGSVLRRTANGVEFGVAGSRFPWAVYHRGGAGSLRAADVVGKGITVSSANQRRPWKLVKAGSRFRKQEPQKWALWWYLFLTYGVPLSAAKLREGLFTPYRPHATINPEIRTRAAALASAFVTGRPLPKNFGGPIQQGAAL